MVNSDPRTGLARPWVPDGDRKKKTREDLKIILESETPKENFETNKKIHFRRRRGHCYFGKIFQILCNSDYEFNLDCHPIRCGCGAPIREANSATSRTSRTAKTSNWGTKKDGSITTQARKPNRTTYSKMWTTNLCELSKDRRILILAADMNKNKASTSV